MSFTQYVRFLLVGGLVALVTILARELVAHLLASDTVANYSISVLLAYALGILLSYLLNHRFTFQPGSRVNPQAALRFIAVALIGMAVTALLSVAIRYVVPIAFLRGPYSGAVAFGTAALITSLITYPLNAKLVFGIRR